VLLVDHRDPEAPELHAPVDERVRADHDVDVTGRQALGDAAALCRGKACSLATSFRRTRRSWENRAVRLAPMRSFWPANWEPAAPNSSRRAR
jgi:hypothetical protein